jgi:hypothetical protein
MAWNTPRLLRIDAELLFWNDAADAVTAAEAKLLRAPETAREQWAPNYAECLVPTSSPQADPRPAWFASARCAVICQNSDI